MNRKPSLLENSTTVVLGFACRTELVVAADGSAKYKTVQEAVMAIPAGRLGKGNGDEDKTLLCRKQ
jgi:hypothetical protein